MTEAIFTIGHSSRTLDQFAALLQSHRVRTVVDVRSTPRSQYVPHFNRNRLPALLEPWGIGYLFMGQSLGGRPQEDAFYGPDGRVDYRAIARGEEFRRGIANLLQQAQRGRTALMCTEKDPLRCHRTLLVAHQLEQQGIPVVHMIEPGKDRKHPDLIEELAARFSRCRNVEDPKQRDLLAVGLQARNVGYRRREKRGR